VRVITAKYAGLSIHRRHLIYADLAGEDVCQALNIKIRSPAPVLDLCRALIRAGYDPATPLEAYRGKVMCLRVRSIGEAANLRISSDHSVEFKSLPKPATAPPMRSQHQAARRAA
jgi:hypothetical protein